MMLQKSPSLFISFCSSGSLRTWFQIVTILWLIWSPPVLAKTTLEAKDYTLSNGLRVILVRQAKAPLVDIQVWYRVGSADEVQGKTGIAHMLEHMMFQGTPKILPEQFSKMIARLGGEDNASTSFDFTNYYVKIAANQLELALDLEADRMRHLLLSKKEFKAENLVVREERRTSSETNLSRQFIERIWAESYGKHPYGRPVIGSMQDLRNLTVADLRQWYEQYYAPNNATLILAGDVDFTQAEGLIQRYFGPLPPHPNLQRPDPPKITPRTKTKQFVMKDQRVKLPTWQISYPAPTLADTTLHTDIHALDVLSEILAGGKNSRLYQELILNRKIALKTSAGFSSVTRFPSLFMVTVVPKENVSMDQVEQATLEVIERIAHEEVTDRELQRTKNDIVADYIYSQDNVHEIAWIIGSMVTSGIDWHLIETYPDHIQAVTARQIQEAAQRYLSVKQATIGRLVAKKKRSKKS